MPDNYLKNNLLLVVIILILLFPALFINLGLLPLSADEATRATVAIEMEYSGNLITPTINGDFYFNKPPLYNWILLLFFVISGSHSELIIRLPMIISLLLYGWVIFSTTKKHIGERNAFLSAMIFITCGRILFYDSMLGLIDTTYSLLIFINFILIYKLSNEEKYLRLFLLSWLLIAMGFLMKGLPTLLFQGITLIAAFSWQKKFKKLLTIEHLSGIFLFILITGSYYFLLWKNNPDGRYFETLFNESAKRTFLTYGIKKTIVNLFTFPFIQLYHLLPWSLMIIFVFTKKFYTNLNENQFLKYLGLVFIVNIPVYWISVETYPRYMFMLYPILFILLLYAYNKSKSEDLPRKIVDVIFLTVIVLMIPAIFWAKKEIQFESNAPVTMLAIAITGICILIIYLFIKNKSLRPELLIIMLLVVRIAFNLVVLPERAIESRTVLQKNQALHVAEISVGEDLLLQRNATCSHETTFYIESRRGEILYRSEGDFRPGILYIFDGRDDLWPKEELIYSFETRWQNIPLRLSRIREN